jgi:uncharacterized protein (DUF2141 family)
MTMKRNVGLLLILMFLLAGCAKIVTPVGGPKDTTPPAVVKEAPANSSTHFRSKTIKVTFNEFVVLNNPSKTVIVSPPLKQNPELDIVGKSVVIKLPDTLQDNTTYSIVLSETIKDYTEGNPLSIYTYSFSTGDHIDSFMIKGKIKEALTLNDAKDVYIFLYEQDMDSLPYSVRPTYLTKSKNNGEFVFNNIRPGKYKVFALNDINNNLIYDLPNESIAFCDTLVEAYASTQDSSTDGKNIRPRGALEKNNGLRLSLFTERDSNQVLSKYINTTENIYVFPYKTDFSSFSARFIGGQELQYFQVISESRDSVYWYLKEPITDTALYEFTVDQRHVDTVKLSPFKKSKQGGFGRKRSVEKPILKVNISNKENIFRPLTLNFSYPVKAGQFDILICKRLKSGNDTIVKTYTLPDTFLLSYPINYPFEEKLPYSILIRDSVFYGYNGTTNDSINVRFTTKTEKDYGNLQINYSVGDPSCQYLVYLLNNRGHILQENVIKSKRSINYAHLEPGNYKIKVVKDRNNNGHWDTGSYRDKRQPEEIFFFDKPINIRGYWDIEEDFELH